MKYVYVCNPRGSVRKLLKKDTEDLLKQEGWRIVTDQALIKQGYIPEFDLGPAHPIQSPIRTSSTQPANKERTAFATIVV